jgi:hypothetical protein
MVKALLEEFDSAGRLLLFCGRLVPASAAIEIDVVRIDEATAPM